MGDIDSGVAAGDAATARSCRFFARGVVVSELSKKGAEEFLRIASSSNLARSPLRLRNPCHRNPERNRQRRHRRATRLAV